MQELGGKTTAQLDPALIQKSTQPLHSSLLGPGEAALLRQHPLDLGLGDDPRTESFEKQLTKSHGFVTNPLHPAPLMRDPRPASSAATLESDWRK
jgi:hypothetical protein